MGALTKFNISTLSAVLLLALAGCGGGSSGGTEAASTTPGAAAPGASTETAGAAPAPAPAAADEPPAAGGSPAPAGSIDISGLLPDPAVNIAGVNTTPVVQIPIFTPMTPQEIEQMKQEHRERIVGNYSFDQVRDPAALNAVPTGHVFVGAVGRDEVGVNLGFQDRQHPFDPALPEGLQLNMPYGNSNLSAGELYWTFTTGATLNYPGHRNHGANFMVQGRFEVPSTGQPRIVDGRISITNAAEGFEIIPGSGPSINFTATCSNCPAPR